MVRVYFFVSNAKPSEKGSKDKFDRWMAEPPEVGSVIDHSEWGYFKVHACSEPMFAAYLGETPCPVYNAHVKKCRRDGSDLPPWEH